MIKNINNKGFTLFETIIVIVILALIGFVGYYVYHSHHKKNTNTSNSVVQSSTTTAVVTDSWTGSGSTDSWSNASNWTKGVPKSGDNLVFNMPSSVASSTGELNSNDDITNLKVNNISFSGGSSTGSTGITLSGNPVYLSGGITNNAGKTTDIEIDNPINLVANQSYKAGSAGGLDFHGQINESSYSLDLVGQTTINNLSGSGQITVEANGDLYFNYGIDNSSFNGSLVVEKNGILSEGSDSGFGNASINVNNGGALEFVGPNSGSETIPNTIILNGSGVNSSIDSNPGAIFTIAQPSTPTTINFSGEVTLDGNTELGNDSEQDSSPVTYNFEDTINTNSYSLTAIPNTGVTISTN